MNEFFEELGGRLAAAGERRDVSVPPPTLDQAVARELLDLARVAAHTQERRFAPLATYLAGAFIDRFKAAGGTSDPAEIASMLREVRGELEREADASTPVEVDTSQ